VAIALALTSALLYGLSDFVAGRASRRTPAVAIAIMAELVMLVVCVIAVPLIEDHGPSRAAVIGGLVSGVSGSIAVLGLYIALARGNMTVVSPVTGVIAAVVPVVAGVAYGDRPGVLAVAGIVIAIVAVALIGGADQMLFGSGRSHADPATIVLALAVGAGFGVMFIALARTGDSGMWPLLFSRFSGLPVLVLVFLIQRRRQPVPIGRGVLVPGVIVGLVVIGSNATYLLSTREGMLAIVAVVVSMYPASTVLLATLLDGERARRPQVAGMALAAASLVMVTVS
jgi:drug/metabolite transporter (DMT)-like permease